MPALSRTVRAAASYALSGMMLAAAVLLHPHAGRADDLDRIREQALALVNQSRKEHNLPPLVLEAKLNKAAQAHANDMLKRNYFAHSSPEGKTVGDRYRQASGGKWLMTAENIYKADHTPAPITDKILKRLQEGWMNSPGHRKNILLRGITEFGFGIAVDAGGNLYAVQNFAGPGADTRAAGGKAKSIGPDEQMKLVLAAVNAERKKAGRPPLAANEALTRGAIALLPGKSEDRLSLEKKNILDLIPAVEGQSWSTVSVVGAMCGGCGTRPVGADITNFTSQWMKDDKFRAVLLNPEVTHLGFTIGVDGTGKKTAIGVFGEREAGRPAGQRPS
jgi:uncharacterized protein YkwD